MTNGLQIAVGSPKTYATYLNAVNKFLTACEKVGVTKMRYLIAATPEGRFYPVALPSADELQLGVYLAHAGVSIART